MSYQKAEYMTAKEVAEFAGYPYRHLWTYQKRGILPPADFHIGNKPIWLKTSIDQWKTTKASQDEIEVSKYYQ
jgi:predicted DNA-binding transcriptional regulator AlpA